MVLHFDDDSWRSAFEFCFVGFVLGGSLQDKKGMTVLRREVALFEKLERISDPKPCGKKMINGEAERQVKPASAIEIDATEFDLLYGYLSIVPWQTGTPARHALETLDWLVARAGTTRAILIPHDRMGADLEPDSVRSVLRVRRAFRAFKAPSATRVRRDRLATPDHKGRLG